MQWALVNTTEIQLEIGYWNDEEQYIDETITATPGTICNLIVYDGESEFTPPEPFVLKSVADGLKIGDFVGL